jgi:V8-like Glu-specific endopeptidase
MFLLLTSVSVSFADSSSESTPSTPPSSRAAPSLRLDPFRHVLAHERVLRQRLFEDGFIDAQGLGIRRKHHYDVGLPFVSPEQLEANRQRRRQRGGAAVTAHTNYTDADSGMTFFSTHRVSWPELARITSVPKRDEAVSTPTAEMSEPISVRDTIHSREHSKRVGPQGPDGSIDLSAVTPTSTLITHTYQGSTTLPTVQFLFSDAGCSGCTKIQETTGLCSGYMIDEYHVLTAAHCVYDRANSGLYTNFWVAPGQTDLLAPSAVQSRDLRKDAPVGYAHAPTIVVPAAFYSDNSNPNFPWWEYDVAVMVLDRKVGIRTGYPMLYGSDVSVNDAIDMFGYPAGSETQKPGLYLYHRTGNVNYDQVDGLGGDWYMCTGDSGGPVFKTIDSTQYIVGVNSYHNRNDNTNCGSTGNYAHGLTANEVTWIGEKVAQTKSIGAYIPADKPDVWPVVREDYLSSQVPTLHGLNTTTAIVGATVEFWTHVINLGTAETGIVEGYFYIATNGLEEDSVLASGEYFYSTAWGNMPADTYVYARGTVQIAAHSSAPTGTFYIGMRYLTTSPGYDNGFTDQKTIVLGAINIVAESFSWQKGAPDSCSTSCVKLAHYYCTRSDGVVVREDKCSGSKPAAEPATCTDGEQLCSYSWETGAFDMCSDSCTKTAVYHCQRADGQHVDDSSCSQQGVKPSAVTESCTAGQGNCRYNWVPGTFGSCSSSCQSSASYVCQRGDLIQVAGSYCSGSQPADAMKACTGGSCAYDWKQGPFGSCTDSCHKTAEYFCQRSDTQSVPDANCDGAKPSPVMQPCSAGDGSCSYSWVRGSFGSCSTSCSKSASYYCQRADGTSVDGSLCSGARPGDDIQECSHGQDMCAYAWTQHQFGACSTSCSKSADYYCRRGDSATVDDSKCAIVGTKPATATQTCTNGEGVCAYAWTQGEFGSCSTSCSQSASYFCKRSDDVAVAGNLCDGNQPADASNTCSSGTDSCSLTWTLGAYGSCSTSCSKTAGYYCLRADGQTVGDSDCAALISKPPAETASCSHGQDLCTFTWTRGVYGACSTSCSKSADYHCQRGDSATVDDSKCAAVSTKPATATQTCTNGEGVCAYAWTQGEFGSCSTSCSQSASYFCKRSDDVAVAGNLCDGNQPADASNTCSSGTDSCSLTWTLGAYGSCSTSCSKTAGYYCLRADGQTVGDSDCAALISKPPAETASCSHGQDLCTFTWTRGVYGACSTSCSKSADYHCQRGDSATVDDSKCAAVSTKPATATQTCTNGEGVCAYAWTQGEFGSCSTSCNKSASYFCKRSDDVAVAGNLCDGNQPADASNTCSNGTDSCSLTWTLGAYGSCSTSCSKTAEYYCLRSDTQTVGDSDCASYSTKPSVETLACSTGQGDCGYSWQQDGAATSDQCTIECLSIAPFACKRNDGTIMADSFCTGMKPDPDTFNCVDGSGACNYTWIHGDFSSCTDACVQLAEYTCFRGDGATVADAKCTGSKPADAQLVCVDGQGPCSYDWEVDSSAAPDTCTIACTGTIPYVCKRGDGETIADSICATKASKPSGVPFVCSSGLGSCVYSWVAGDFGTCSNACNKTAEYFCQRSDLQPADASRCITAKPSPVVQACSAGAGLCSYSWIRGSFGSCAASCNESASYFCQRADGTSVDGSLCSGARPGDDMQECSHGQDMCAYAWTQGQFGACSTSCSKSADYYCQRGDSATVDDSKCAVVGTKPTPATQNCTNGDGACAYVWTQDEFGSCSTSCNKSASYFCKRSDDVAVADTLCDGNQPADASSTCSNGTDSCSLTWTLGAYGSCSTSCSRTAGYYCLRADGRTVGDSDCASYSTKPSAATASCSHGQDLCTFTWDRGVYGACSTSCSKSADYFCQRGDSATVNDSKCAAVSTKPTPAAQACTNGEGVCAYAWTQDEFGSCSTSCNKSASYFCKRSDDVAVADTLCDGNQPADASSTCSNGTDSCSLTWTLGAYGSCSTSCSKTAGYYCLRADGRTVGDSDCASYSTKPSAATSSCSHNEDDCSYSWQLDGAATSDQCTIECVAVAPYVCKRSDGVTTSDSFCTGMKPDPGTFRCVHGNGACNYTWTQGSFGSCTDACVKSAEFSCFRGDGLQVGNDNCTTPQPSPVQLSCVNEQGACTYSWNQGNFGACSLACEKSASFICNRGDGKIVPSSNCAGSRPANVSASCSSGEGVCMYSWIQAAYSSCASNCTKSASHFCQRSDSMPVNDSKCADPKPDPDVAMCEANEGACSYSWLLGDYSSCTTSCNKSASFVCRRADLVAVSSSRCASNKPANKTLACSDGDGLCAYDWVLGNFGNCSVDCQKSASYSCQRADGTPVDAGLCSSPQPSDISNTCQVGDGLCAYQWSEAVGQCTSTCQQTVTHECKRADGQVVPDSFCGAKPADSARDCQSGQGECVYTWTLGEYGSCSYACEETAEYKCVRADQPSVAVLFSKCVTAKPESKKRACAAGEGQCTYLWTSQGFANCSTECEKQLLYKCVRSDAQNVADSLCTAPKPPSLIVYCSDGEGECAYNWVQQSTIADSASTCSRECVGIAPYTCERGDGESFGDIYCSGRGPKPPIQRFGCSDGQGDCHLEWVQGAFGRCSSMCTESAAFECMLGGVVTVDASRCSTERPNPVNQSCSGGSCGYSWVLGNYGVCESSCTKKAEYKCHRADGLVVSDNWCVSQGPRPANNITVCDDGQCVYQWNVLDTELQCDATCFKHRSTQCINSANQVVNDQYCWQPRPEVKRMCTGGACPYSYSWAATPFGGCTLICTQTREVYCARSDGERSDSVDRCSDQISAKYNTSRACTGGACISTSGPALLPGQEESDLSTKALQFDLTLDMDFDSISNNTAAFWKEFRPELCSIAPNGFECKRLLFVHATKGSIVVVATVQPPVATSDDVASADFVKVLMDQVLDASSPLRHNSIGAHLDASRSLNSIDTINAAPGFSQLKSDEDGLFLSVLSVLLALVCIIVLFGIVTWFRRVTSAREAVYDDQSDGVVLRPVGNNAVVQVTPPGSDRGRAILHTQHHSSSMSTLNVAGHAGTTNAASNYSQSGALGSQHRLTVSAAARYGQGCALPSLSHTPELASSGEEDRRSTPGPSPGRGPGQPSRHGPGGPQVQVGRLHITSTHNTQA